MYDTTAFLYEKNAAFEDPETRVTELEETLTHFGVPSGGQLGDFGCGTGLISIAFAQRGWHVYGIDLSQAMLDEATKKLEKLPTEIQKKLTFTQGDITNIALPKDMMLDAALCLCNTVNHLTDPKHVKQLAQGAFNAIKPSGLFIFDSDTYMTFQEYFDHEPIVVWDDGLYKMSRACDFDSQAAQTHHVATLEKYNDDGSLSIESTEDMTLQYHAEEDLNTYFTNAGFTLVSAEPYNPFPESYDDDFVSKVLWVFQRDN